MFAYQGGRTGKGLLNSLINKLPVELHLKGYEFCGPGTKLEKRLKRGDQGINKLDQACREHDISYSKNRSLQERHIADQILENSAWERVKSKDAKLKEKAAAWFVTTAMKTKRKLGMGIASSSKIPFKRGVLNHVRKSLRKNTFKGDLSNNKKMLKKASIMALKAARVAVKKAGGRKNIRTPRIIQFNYGKQGGLLPLLPILAGLGALGSLIGGASAVANTAINSKNAIKKLEEDKRHHQAMEEIGKKGSGIYLRKNARGYGLFLKKKNFQ